MAVRSTGHIRQPRPALALLAAPACVPVCAQTRLSLEEAGLRNESRDFIPMHLGKRVSIAGTVNSTAFHFPAYSLLAIEKDGFGGVLQLAGKDLHADSFRPGDDVEATGTV